MGRALSAGKEPTIPALHWAITKAGCETMNSGAPTAGSLSLSFRMFGSAIESPWRRRANGRSAPSFTYKPTATARASAPTLRSFRLRQPGADKVSASVTTETLREPWHEGPRLVDQRMRRIDDKQPGARERLLAVRADWPGPYVQFEPQDVWHGQRGDRVEKMGIELELRGSGARRRRFQSAICAKRVRAPARPRSLRSAPRTAGRSRRGRGAPLAANTH